MKWPWRSKITEVQARELGKFMLTLCHTTIIGSVGYLFVPQSIVFVKIAMATLGMILSLFLFILAMRVLREVKNEI